MGTVSRAHASGERFHIEMAVVNDDQLVGQARLVPQSFERLAKLTRTIFGANDNRNPKPASWSGVGAVASRSVLAGHIPMTYAIAVLVKKIRPERLPGRTGNTTHSEQHRWYVGMPLLRHRLPARAASDNQEKTLPVLRAMTRILARMVGVPYGSSSQVVNGTASELGWQQTG